MTYVGILFRFFRLDKNVIVLIIIFYNGLRAISEPKSSDVKSWSWSWSCLGLETDFGGLGLGLEGSGLGLGLEGSGLGLGLEGSGLGLEGLVLVLIQDQDQYRLKIEKNLRW